MATFPVLFRRLAAALALLASVAGAHAMSVIAPSFNALVGDADTIVQGVVTDVHAETFDSPQGQGIRTLVTLKVERTLKGSAGPTITLSLLGGTVGHRTLTVVGMPQFNVGDREIVFVADNGRTICPLVAAGHGRFFIRHDPATGRDYVTRNNGVPLASTAEVNQPLSVSGPPPSPAGALSPEDFEARIAAAVRPARPVIQP